ncbi:nuclear transport factor 2 family protein [Labilibaculum sp.]|uniref:nuclear transport factor 2 family protein n=1 Tax=Labilibaculum sp. TaxID=2060723 RepID=UPI003561E418
MPKLLLIFGILFLSSCNASKPITDKNVSDFIDLWHQAASNAELDTFFDMMSESSIYIGTDASERWSKKEFYEYCEPRFTENKTWHFKPYNRQIYLSKDQETIWFDELLNTRMGICRGSGVVENINGELKISHYHLSVTIKNEKMNEFLQINQK